MAITSTQVKNSASVVQIAVGRYIDTGTVALVTITTGFKPLYIKIVNLASTGSQLEWFHGMAADSGMKRVTAGDMTLTTSLAITQLEYGFSFGIDTDLLVTSEQISWMAIG